MRGVRGAGEYNKPIAIEQESTTASANAFGRVETHTPAGWETFIPSLRAAFMTRGGREFYRASQQFADLTHVARVRRSADTATITPEMRVKTKYGTTRYLNVIASYDIDEAGRETELVLREAV